MHFSIEGKGSLYPKGIYMDNSTHPPNRNILLNKFANHVPKSESRLLASETGKSKTSLISKMHYPEQCTEMKLDDSLSLEAAPEMQFHVTLSYIILFSV